MHIEIDDLTRPAIHALLQEHMDSMYALSPSVSVHALDLSALRSPQITLWSAWESAELLGCGALKELIRHWFCIKCTCKPSGERWQSESVDASADKIVTKAMAHAFAFDATYTSSQ